MSSAEGAIIERLKEHEPTLGTRAIARELGVSPALWVRVRDGDQRLGAKLADAAARLLPELEPKVLIFLRYELPNRKRALRTRKSEQNGRD